MGYTRHNTIIVTAAGYAFDPGFRAQVPDVEAFRASLPEDWRRLIVGPVQSVTNDYRTFAFLPDGSKEGWGTSADGDTYRQQFLDLFSFAYDDGSSPYDVLVVDARFGGDEPLAGYEPELIVTSNLHCSAAAGALD